MNAVEQCVLFLVTRVSYLNILILRQERLAGIEQIVLASKVYKFRKLGSQPKCSSVNH